MKIANNKARQYVTDKVEFDGSNTFGRWYGSLSNGKPPVYVVFSYGYHFPMFAYINGEWFENNEKYSITTSKQQSQLRPACFGDIYLIDGDRLRANINEMACSSICK
tara:strand:+ start:293 stop:613 length:321 start_codon:yes stop_codon:yes gene_type:complete